MHELMVHVEQVLVHEGVVAGHLAVQPPRLVIAAPEGAEGGRQAGFRQRGIAGKHEDEVIHLARRIAAHSVGNPAGAEIGDVDALAAAIVGPAMVVAFELVAAHHAEVQRHLPMGAAVFQGKDLAAHAAIQDDGRLREPAGESPPGFELVAPGHGVPVIGVCADPPQIESIG